MKSSFSNTKSSHNSKHKRTVLRFVERAVEYNFKVKRLLPQFIQISPYTTKIHQPKNHQFVYSNTIHLDTCRILFPHDIPLLHHKYHDSRWDTEKGAL